MLLLKWVPITREKYLKDHAPIFLEGGATLCFMLGLNENDTFVPLKIQGTETTTRIKSFNIRLYYDLYIS